MTQLSSAKKQPNPKLRIVVVGIGYVGLSNAVLLARRNHVTAVDTDQTRVDSVNKRLSPLADPELERYLRRTELSLTALTDGTQAYTQADIIIIATPTNYDDETEQFDTSSVETVLAAATSANPAALIVIKSTVPVGFTERMRQKHANRNIVFSPEFLREGRALYDNLHPSRIIVGDTSTAARRFADLLAASALDENVPVLYMSSTEAEAVKLFANTYLAMRVAFFNELDTYAEIKNLDSQNLIRGISLDPRIGDHYNNPSFGYGGYCLPKDTKQLLANYRGVPNDLIKAVVRANATRMQHVAESIVRRRPALVGIYRLTMKTGSDNFRQSAIQTIIQLLQRAGMQLVLYEPLATGVTHQGIAIERDLSTFKRQCDCIVANRMTDELADAAEKVYTRDLFARD